MTQDNAAGKSANTVWHQGAVDRSMREQLHRHRGGILWFTGLSGSGKSTLAHAVEAALFVKGCSTYVCDGDNVRHGLNGDLGFSPADRVENIRRIAEVSKLFMDAGVIVLTAFISPYREDRDRARALVGAGDFIEVFVDCPIEVCESRDVKGLYKKARAGEIPEFTGISAPYEAPSNPEIAIATAEQTVEQSAELVMNYLVKAGILSAD